MRILNKCYGNIGCKTPPTRYYQLLPTNPIDYNRDQPGTIYAYCERHWQIVFYYEPWIELSEKEIIVIDIIER